MYHLASPVAVLTVAHRGRLHGTTVSTATLVSHRPLILGASLRADSVLAELAVAEGRFSVNVLDGDQGGLARWFADSGRPEGSRQFDGLQWRHDPYTTAPLLDGALAQYTCRTAGRTPVGDHEVLLGRVVRASAEDFGVPLLSYAGGLYVGELFPVTDHSATRPSEKGKQQS
nr:flavin reductase family protein [Kitasatospora sp. SID7827]